MTRRARSVTTNDYVAVSASRAATQRDPKSPYVVALEAQLDGLRRLEDPANDSPTAVVYREMLGSANTAKVPALAAVSATAPSAVGHGADTTGSAGPLRGSGGAALPTSDGPYMGGPL